MVEAATPESVILPARDYMDAAETMSWIGYGKALRKFDWCEHLFRLSRDWKFHDAIGIATEDPPMTASFREGRWFSSAHELLDTFKARAFGSIWPPYPRIKTEDGQNCAEKYLARFVVNDASGWKDLGRQLKADIERRDQFHETLRVAGGKLRRELYKNMLTAWGSKDTSDPFNGPPRQRIVPDEWPPGVEIDFDGNVREKEGWDWSIRWMLLSFDTEEVLAIWPTSRFQHQSRLMIEGGEQNTPPNDPVLVWLLEFVRSELAQRGAPPKREETLRACQKGRGCTYRQARAAWDALPAEMKRKPRSAKAPMEAR
jgi:hypothetical protein